MQPPESPPGSHSQPPSQSVSAKPSWAWPVAWMVTILAVISAGIYVFKSCRDLPVDTLNHAGKVIEQVGQKAQLVAAAFRQGTITTTFTSYATSLSGSQYLQFATLSQMETFTRKDEASMAFGYIPLPDVIVEATAPVSYTYYLDLNAHWDFQLRDGVLWVVAPDIKFNKPSVDASRITYEVKKNSLIRNTSEAVANLKDSITWLSIKKAQANIDLVRETGRRQTETFVHNWLLKAFTDGKNYPVKVTFHNELAKHPDLSEPGKE
ncbi:MAG TPA: hypothetical protein VHI52_06835 [Verrucomicrobiae bacterium]|nr:hypothetical protein [Verrucomicrobiae bacterium]